MDLLKREMERKKKAIQEAKQRMLMQQQGGGKNPRNQSRRFVKASDLRRYAEEENSLDSVKRHLQQDIALSTSNLPLDDGPCIADVPPNVDEDNLLDANSPNKKRKLDDLHQENLSDSLNMVESMNQSKALETVIRELRSFGLPVTLFGETLFHRLRRLQDAKDRKAVVRLQESEADEFRLGHGHGIRNPFLEKDDVITSSNEAVVTASLLPNDNQTKSKKNKDITNEDEVDGPPDPHKRIYRHFKGLLRQWEADLNERSDDLKRSLAGRNETKTLKQCKDYIRPLFQLCKRRQLEDNLLMKLEQMVIHCEQGEFVRAHDAYLDVAIGRAAWPIGVTMVGIHARTGRAKIESSNVAHVMNSELQRKYLTSVKRLLTYEQNKRIDVDPSKKVR